MSTTVTLNTRDLIDAVERASLVINDRIKSPLICDFHDSEIQISCTTPLGSVTDVIPAKIEGNSEEMGFNSRFLLDALKNTETDEVRIELGGALSPMKVLPPEGEAFLFLVLPVRLKKIRETSGSCETGERTAGSHRHRVDPAGRLTQAGRRR